LQKLKNTQLSTALQDREKDHSAAGEMQRHTCENGE